MTDEKLIKEIESGIRNILNKHKFVFLDDLSQRKIKMEINNFLSDYDIENIQYGLTPFQYEFKIKSQSERRDVIIDKLLE